MSNNDPLDDFLDHYGPGQTPAGPEGLPQTPAQGTRPGNQGGSQLSQWLDTYGATRPAGTPQEEAQSWFAGANNQGVNNGWENQFVDDFTSGWDQALESGTAADYFRNAEANRASGVVTWDHKSADGQTSYHFGDVYENGKFVHNLYDQFPDDPATADLLMAPWILDAKQQAEIFSDNDRTNRLHREISDQREERTNNFELSLQALAFQTQEVDPRKEAYLEGNVDTAIAGGGAVLGAALAAGAAGAATGSITGPGAIATGVAGFVIGGTAAWLNRDSLTEQLARANAIVDMSYEENGLWAGSATAVSQWSQFGGKLISPLSNLTQGIYDVSAGTGGDGSSEFYKVDEEGKRTVPGFVKGLDVAATVGDSLLQFASPIGVNAYTAQMSGTILGEVAELGFSGGQQFDYRRGGFDNIFTDEDGKFDFTAAAAGIGKIGIDFVQLGMVRGLAGGTNAARIEAGKTGVYTQVSGALNSRLPLWMGGSRGLAAGEERVRAGSYSFTRNAEGDIVEGSRRATLGLLAPSEQVVALNARVMASRAQARSAGALSTDDFYRAAQATAAGERKLQGIVVNGMGESYEEAIQAILEPHSHGSTVTGQELWDSALYGFAAGAGMGAGFTLRSTTADDKMFAMAQLAHRFTTGGAELTREEWNGWNDLQKRSAASMTGVVRETAQAAFKRIVDDMAIEMNGGVAASHRLKDAVQSRLQQDLARATDRTDGAFVISSLESMPRVDADGNLLPGEIPVNGVASSAIQLARNLANHGRGIAIQLGVQAKDNDPATGLYLKLAEAQAALAADPTNDELIADEARAQRNVDIAVLTLQWGKILDGEVSRLLDSLTSDTRTRASVAADAAELNNLLQDAFNLEVVSYQGTQLTQEDKLALARAVSALVARDPHDAEGSFQLLVPQVSVELTLANTQDFLEVSHAILQSIRGDYDGDKVRPLNQLVLDDAAFENARSGSQFVGVGESVNIASPAFEALNIEQLSESLNAGTTTSVALQAYATGVMTEIGSAIRKRYRGSIADIRDLDRVLTQFYEAVEANNPDARAVLLDGLAKHVGSQLNAFARTNLSNEWLWVDQLIVSKMQEFQEAYAAQRPIVSQVASDAVAEPVQQELKVRTRSQAPGATPGQWLAQILPGDSLFRKFQKLHYTVLGADVLSSQSIAKMPASEMAMFYRELSQGITRKELDVVRSKDDITGRVYVQLMRLADDAQKLNPDLDRFTALTVMANLAVTDLEINEDTGEVTEGKDTLSLAQLLLKQSVMQDQREKARVLESSPELQAKHARLMRYTRPNSTTYAYGAEAAFIEVVGSQQFYTLLGDSSMPFGPHLTVEQYLRHYISMDPTSRTEEMRERLFRHEQYQGKKQHYSMPYTLTDAGAGLDGTNITGYRALVDAIAAVGNNRLSVDKDGTLSGEYASRSDAVAENFQAGHRAARTALQEFATLNGRPDGQLSAELVQSLMEADRDFATSIFKLVPNAAAAASFQAENGEVFAANWFYTMFTIENAAEAEMHLWRNLLLTEWFAKGMQTYTQEQEDGSKHGREYHRLSRRMHRIMYTLNKQSDGGLLYREFINELESATDLKTFMQWVNSRPGIRGNQAPIVPWFDDVAEFDADKAQGGWTTSLEGSELREAIATLRSRAEMLVTSLRKERDTLASDIRALAALERVEKGDPAATEQDRELHARMVTAIEQAGQWMSSLGPNEMGVQTIGAALGFYAQAHTKGTNPPNVINNGLFEATRDDLSGFVTNFERYRDSLTTYNLDEVGGSLSEVAKDGGRTMDDYGRVVEWTVPTVGEMIEFFKDPALRPYARSIMFPQVMERDLNGNLRSYMLVGHGLSELLSKVTYSQLFPTNGVLSRDASEKYLSMVEGVARRHDGNQVVQRLINDLVIARTSAADHTLSAGELAKMKDDAHYDVARLLQAVGAVASIPAEPGTDTLGDVLEGTKVAMRQNRIAKRLGLELADRDSFDVVLQDFVRARRNEMLETLQDLSLQLSLDPSREAEIDNLSDLEQKKFDLFERNVQLLLTDDVAGQVERMFSIDSSLSPDEQTANRQAIVEYIWLHPAMIETASAAKTTVNKLMMQKMDAARHGQVTLTSDEWAQLSAAVTAHYFEDAIGTVAIGASISPWPDPTKGISHKYYDDTYAYLVQDLLDSTSPIVQAAKDIHRLAGRQNDVAERQSPEDLAFLLETTVLNPKKLGPWTSDIVRASAEANSRLDSSAAAPAIAMAGNSPKRLAVLIAATRRTYRIPDAALLSRITIPRLQLNIGDFDTIVYADHAGAKRRTNRAELNNRFARSVVMTATDNMGQTVTIDLLATDRELGRPWLREETVATSGYYEVHTERIDAAVTKALTDNPHLLGQTVSIDMEFFHPDSQPGGPEWANNIFFEGTNYKLDADDKESLLATGWFGTGGISPAAQAAALEASKKGKSALQVIPRATAAERVAIEAGWARNLADVLKTKARRMLETDLGFGRLEIEEYNHVLKDLKIRHYVSGTDDQGERVLWRAEQVIEFQRANPGAALPLSDAKLWVPSPDVLRDLLGEQGGQGTSRYNDRELEIDPSRISRFTAVTSEMLDQFKEGIAGETLELHKTRAMHQAHQSQLIVRTELDNATRDAFDTRIQYFKEQVEQIGFERGTLINSQNFNPGKNLQRAVRRGKQAIAAGDLTMHWSRVGIPFGPRNPADSILSRALLQSSAALTAQDNFRTGWVYREGSQAEPLKGRLSEVSLGATDRGQAFRVAPGDLVVVELDSFAGNFELAKKRIDHFSQAGATIVLVAPDGQADIRAEMSEYLQSDKNYESVIGSKHMYTPIELGTRFQNRKARISSLVETRPISARNRVMQFSPRGLGIQEGTAWVDQDNAKLRTIAVSANLVPTSAMAGYNVPVEDLADQSQVEFVREKLRRLNTAAGRKLLMDQANGKLKGDERKKADAEFLLHWQHMLQRFDDHSGKVLPQPGDTFGPGDMIPLINNTGDILIYRHGFKALRRDQIDELSAQLLGGRDAVGVAVFPSIREGAATVHTGTIVEFKPRAGFGLAVEMEIPLSVFGNKLQLEWNGMKYILTPRPKDGPGRIELPSEGLFKNWGIDVISDADTLFGKEAFGDIVDNHRMAFAAFGIDFLPDVTEFFFPGQRDNLDMRNRALNMLKQVNRMSKGDISIEEANELMQLENLSTLFSDRLPTEVINGVVGLNPQWPSLMNDMSSVETRVTSAILIYLMTPGSRVEDVLRSGGFNNETATIDGQSRLMPRLFTQIFDQAPMDSALRRTINQRLNMQIQRDPATGKRNYVILPNFMVQIRNKTAGKNMEGWLSFPEAHSAGDNPIRNGMSFDDSERGAVSAHSAAIAFGAIGAETAMAHDFTRARLFQEAAGVERFTRDVLDGGAWRMLTDIPDSDNSFQNWVMASPAEAMRREMAREALVQFRQEIEKSKANDWTEKEITQYRDKALQITRRLGLLDKQVGIVDYWVRQVLGQPSGQDEQGNDLGLVTGRGALAAAEDIFWNVQNGYLPTVGAEVPMLHLHDLQLIYKARAGWKPRESVTSQVTVSSWDDWVNVALGSALVTDTLFDPMFLLALDGYLHTYQSATRSLMELPVSMDTMKTQELLDPATSEMLVSLMPQVQRATQERISLDTDRASIEQILGGKRIAGSLRTKRPPASEISRRREARRKWRQENGVPVPVDVTMGKFRANGADFVHHSTNANVLIRSLIHLRVGTALFNPLLYVSMGPEQWVRGSLDRLANIVTAQGTVGVTSKVQAGLSERVQESEAGITVRKGTDDERQIRFAEVFDRLGLTHRFTPDQIRKLSDSKDTQGLYSVLAQRKDFSRMIFKDLWFQRPGTQEMAIGRGERVLEGYAKFGSKMQDPTWGIRPQTLARRYVEAALQHILSRPTRDVISVDALIDELATNPEFLMRNYPEAHQSAMNNIAQLRSLKETLISKSLKGIIDPMAESHHAGINIFGNLVFKIPLLFSSYASNVATTLLGLQGLDQMGAALLEGRAKGPNSFIGRMQAAVRGEQQESDMLFDMSTVLDGVDIGRAFVRTGLTHTGLFVTGMLAGGLGLGGEDDEAKRRRLLAKHQGVGTIYDPREIENDFRNADAIFGDWMPGGLGFPSWIIKPFTSPMIGIERFLQDGDFRNVRWGFEDALGAFPLINIKMWNDTNETVDLLLKQAQDEQAKGGDKSVLTAATFLTTAVATYEKMLFENSFANSVYVGLDRWDRDPYALPLRDSDGDLQKDIENNTRKNDLARIPYLTDDGKVSEGYLARDSAGAEFRRLTENRGTLALVSSIFLDDTWRYSMPIKTRTIQLEQDSLKLIEAQILAAFQGAGGQPRLTVEEVLPTVRNELYARGDATGHFYTDAEIRNAAMEYVASQNTGVPVGEELASMVLKRMENDPENAALLQDKIVQAQLQGLLHGTTTFGDPGLSNMFLTYDQRLDIQEKWLDRLTQEGIDLGLDETQALKRTDRIWNGGFDDPRAHGIADILWSDKISYQDKQVYGQENTTYAMGPDGLPWATGSGRNPLYPFNGLRDAIDGRTELDARGNTIDLVNGNNTGLRALVPFEDSRNVPTDVEIGKAIEKALADLAVKDRLPFKPFPDKDGGSGSGWKNFGGWGGGGWGGFGGGGGGGGSAYFTRMNPLPDAQTTYGHSTPFINTSNPIIRRANVRRERVWSERGRLKAWQ